MYRSLGQAAAATGVSKSTILRAIKAHRISAERSDTGDWHIDPAELHRVFPVARPAEQAPVHHAMPPDTAATAVLEAQIAGLRDTAELLRRQLDDVRQDRDAWRETAQAGQRLLAAPARKSWRWWRRRAA